LLALHPHLALAFSWSLTRDYIPDIALVSPLQSPNSPPITLAEAVPASHNLLSPNYTDTEQHCRVAFEVHSGSQELKAQPISPFLTCQSL
jgi:hypothetical protein